MAAILEDVSDKVILFSSPTSCENNAIERFWELFAEGIHLVTNRR